MTILRAVLRYRLVAFTLLVSLIGGILWAFTQSLAIQILFSAFALGVAAFLAWHMVKELIQRRFGVDILAVIAIVATVLVGEYVASIVIVLMVSGGRALEDFAESRARRELSSLLAREPQVAHKIDLATQAVSDVGADEVLSGDTILVRSGEVVPVDGRVLSASASFDESSLTGESMPVGKLEGDDVLSGSINGLNAVTIVATATAADSQFQGIIALVRQAQQNRAPVVRLADRYAVPFTAVSLALGVGAWVAAGDPLRFAEVLVLATPCPLLLAAPIAFMGGMSRAARNGVIVKGGSVLESLARIRTAVFDKTGTLTHGVPTVTRINPRAPFDEKTLLALVASAEQFSSHVLATVNRGRSAQSGADPPRRRRLIGGRRSGDHRQRGRQTGQLGHAGLRQEARLRHPAHHDGRRRTRDLCGRRWSLRGQHHRIRSDSRERQRNNHRTSEPRSSRRAHAHR